MNIRSIKTKKDYKQALTRLDEIFEGKKGQPKEMNLSIFSMLIEQYENVHFPIDLPDPIEAIKFRMEQLGKHRLNLRRIVS